MGLGFLISCSASLDSFSTPAPPGCLATAGRCPCQWSLGARAGPPQVIPSRAKGTPRAASASGARAPPAPPDVRNRPAPASPLSAMLYFRCFRHMFSSVSSGCCICCNDYICMLHTYVLCCKHMFSSVSSGCCRSRSGYCITCMFQAYVLCVSGVSYVCCKCFVRMLQK
jgi:hypothetical protein